ncbi:MAG: hypothetical protein HOM21_06775 [Halobacteriovoraceae bacterium]|nr:hypothetical protein [Halobacteriovoraceae bacterium]
MFFKKYRWKKSNCEKTHWKNVRNSNSGDPLIWTVFGDESKVGERGVESTLIFCGVHGDEITPIKFCFDIIQHLTKEVAENPGILKGKLVAIAPIVNPDSFMKKRPTRTNKNSVDINRNFPTKDWNKDALKLWKSRYRRDKRRYPGKKSLSEPEVVFQVNLIKRYKPRKIISVHAPLTMLDYDGPIDHHTGGIVGTRANQLLIQMSKKARGYRIKNYPFFPGSLGNYAGNERNIPTYTLELPTSNPRKSDKYWTLFRPAIHSAIMHDMRKEIDVAVKPASSKATTAN